ncbi:thiazole biosynthesis adenylyltransferase ThiF [Dyadobacter beijingensis]|uniref:Thiazole biosynthesis adenylyltransferase ThiF n=1 Tax=Dyadobacter beijingensis TaxID=365489 RepID=A0ABQ2I7L9_9BACT|nr:HesA/MoeB/ThiF family protein [Dyadobacter beijingensis]GGN02961.1 thiazole biosynthesis adenylyltransferase ThiF [Dyadobacter beijingensis]
MFTTVERKRYARQIIMPEMGLAGQEKLRAGKVAVVGAGGLGCPVLQYLVAAGVGQIGIIDDDTVDLTNLHRQILYSAHDVGQNKAITAVEKLSVLNPFVQLVAYPDRLNAENAADLLSGYDLVIDGSDNFETRYLVNDFCVALGKPFIFGSILRFEGQVSVFNYHGGPTYRCLFPDAEEGDNCAEAGVMGVLPGIIGTYMANEAIKVIAGIGEPLSGKLLVINTLTNSHSIFQFSRSETAGQSAASARPALIPPTEENLPEMSYEEYEFLLESAPDAVLLVDVREYYEFEADSFGGENIPLSDIPENIANFPAGKTIVFYCNSGKRSMQAARLLAQSGYEGRSFWAQHW